MTYQNKITRRGFGKVFCAAALSAAMPHLNSWGMPLSGRSKKQLAIIGCGKRGTSCVTALLEQDSSPHVSRIAFVCDTDRLKGNKLAIQAQAEFTDNWRHCLKTAKIADVIIAIPMDQSFNVALAAIQQKKRIFFDCSNGTNFLSLITKITSDYSTYKRMSVFFPHSPTALTVRKVIESGAIGAIRFVYSCEDNCDVRENTDFLTETHTRQLLFLLEATGLSGTQTMHSIATTGNDKKPTTRITNITFSGGVQLNISSSSISLANKGWVIRGESGSICTHNNGISVLSDEGNMRYTVPVDMNDTRCQALVNWQNHSLSNSITDRTKIAMDMMSQIETRLTSV